MLQVVLKDGRVLLGDLQSFDKQGNINLGNTCESVATRGGKLEERLMGIVLIPLAQQERVELQVRPHANVTCQEQVACGRDFDQQLWKLCAYTTQHVVSASLGM